MSIWNQPGNNVRTIRVNTLARVEGEGALHLLVRQGQLEQARLEIYEPPRFFESFLRGRDFQEVPDITARICGICPVAYQMSACHALEQALGVADQIDLPIRRMRDLFYCGEWIESHVLHMFFLHLPDFLGYESAITMARDYGSILRSALRIRKAGNQIVSLLGGRSVHPVGACVGGFYSLPETVACRQLLGELKQALDQMCELTLFLAREVRYPDFPRDYEFLALQPEDEYPMNRGPIVSSKGLRLEASEFMQVIEERQLPYSTALYSTIKGRGAYHVGPLARLNLNAARLHPRAAELLPLVCRSVGADLPWSNSYFSILARALETLHALARAVDIVADYRQPERSRIPFQPCAGLGSAATEAPRGLLWHEYRSTDDGSIAAARIIPPTAQNQLQIEQDLRALAAELLQLPDPQLQLRCEHLIRNYDPCISCSVHFLRLDRSHS